MAFYLRRAFADDATVAVVNNVRLVRSDQDPVDAAQIDHLVIYPGGLIIIESKSVSTQVTCDQHGQWTRSVPGRCPQGMPSPVIQARGQGAFLRRYLAHAWPELTQAWRGSVLVAISDHGRVEYDGDGKEIALARAAVYKADQVADRVRALVLRAAPLPPREWDPHAVKGFLASHDRPLMSQPEIFVGMPFAREVQAMFGSDTAQLLEALLNLDMDLPHRQRRTRRHIHEDDDEDDDD